MTWNTLNGQLAAVHATVSEVAEVAKIANRQVESFKDKMRRLRNERRAASLDALLEQPLFWQYLELLAIDANHPEVKLHEWLIQRMFAPSISFTAIRKRFRDVQTELKRQQRGAYQGLNRDQVEGILNDLRGLE